MSTPAEVPVIDVGPLRSDDPRSEAVARVARAVDAACRDTGFFCVTGHGVDPALLGSLDGAARRFFALPASDEARAGHGPCGEGLAGLVPPRRGADLRPARPEGGALLRRGAAPDDPRVQAGRPCTARTCSRPSVPELGPAVLGWMSAMTALGHLLLRGIALGLGLEQDWFERDLTRRAHGALPDLPLPADGGRGVGCR